MSSLAQQLRRRISGWRNAEQTANRVRATVSLTPSECLDATEELRALNPALFRDPDPIRDAEVMATRRAWHKVRSRWTKPIRS